VFEQETKKLALLAPDNSFSYFEFVTVLALRIFQAAKCDFVIWETGMGGRLDATNIVKPECCIVTNIALDHQEHLGDTTARIAAEKAGIFKPEVPVFYGKLDEDARQVIESAAHKLGCQVFPPLAGTPGADRIFESDNGFIQQFRYCGKEVKLSLAGAMQRENFRIVYNVLNYLAGKYGFNFDESLTFLDRVIWPARFQKVNSRIIVDGGHNPDGAAALTEALQEFCPNEKFTVIFAAFEDKCVDETVKMLCDYSSGFIFTRPTDWGRAAHSFENLKRLVPDDIPCSWEEDASSALQSALAGERRVLVCGSLYLAGKVLELANGRNAACDLV
jgi:dihydrofolate synthase/folylpolyglutamate synthase